VSVRLGMVFVAVVEVGFRMQAFGVEAEGCLKGGWLEKVAWGRISMSFICVLISG